MEDSSCTDETLALYRELREAGLENVGVVLQGYLRRTLADIASLSDLTPNVRLCKGIYVEPEELAYQDFDEVRENFVAALDALLDAGSYVGIANHDEWLIEEGREAIRSTTVLRTRTSPDAPRGSAERARGSWQKATG